MGDKYVLGITDYVVIALSLLVSVYIGVKFKYSSSKRKTMKEYTMAGQNMSILPVSVSLCVTILSAITIISTPIETYRFGMQFSMIVVGCFIGSIITSYVFTPVYFQCGISSIYEFLELRYGKTTRYAVSGLFIIQMVFFMSATLYGPVLAISAVTDLSLETSVIMFGLVCAFYCTLGGLKAVLWTDVFQAGFMFTCVIALYVKGIGEAGGFSEVYRIAKEGQRWQFFNLQMDLTTKYTLWNTMVRGLFFTLASYGTNQVEVQRILTLRSVSRARMACITGGMFANVLFLMCLFLGMIMYSIFHTCDPLQDKQRTGITRYDQVIPYYIVTRFSRLPGLTGVCIAGIISGSLSTISSIVNSLSTVTVVDFIKPLCSPHWLTETRTVYIAKALSMLYGMLCICFTFVISKSDSLTVINSTLLSIVEGPILAIFLVGVLTRKGSEKCILFSLLLGVAIASWIGYGSIFSGYRHPALPLNSTGCPDTSSSSDIYQNVTCTGMCPAKLAPEKKNEMNTFFLYRISFNWISPIGCVTTIFFIFMTILLTGWRHNVIPADSKCLSPVSRWWTKKPTSLINKLSLHVEHVYLEERTKLAVPENQVDI